MDTRKAADQFEKFVEEKKVVGNQETYQKALLWWFAIPNLLLIIGLVVPGTRDWFFWIFLLVWAGWYGPALSLAIIKPVETGTWAMIDYFGKPILWLAPGAGFWFAPPPLRIFRVRHILLDLNFEFTDIATASKTIAVYESEEERKKYEGDIFNDYRLPVAMKGTIQLYPSGIQFFNRLVSPSEWRKKSWESKNDFKAIELFLEEEIKRQVLPEVASKIAEIVGSKTPAQVIKELATIKNYIAQAVENLIDDWGLTLNAFQLAKPDFAVDILQSFNQNVIAMYAKEIQIIEGEAHRIFTQKKGLGEAEALEALKEKVGLEMYTRYEQFKVMKEAYLALQKTLETGKDSRQMFVITDDLLGKIAGVSPALVSLFRSVTGKGGQELALR